jgi:glycerophosphoryl diester phosphodiesterase
MFFDKPVPIIFAHRGASLYAPENTLAAFKLAIEQGAEAIELDVKLTADSQVVVIHDQTIDRTTNGSGKVNQLTLGELKKFDAGSYFSPEFSGEKVPTLVEVFETVDPSILINIELTNYGSPFDKLPEKVAELVVLHQRQSGVIFSSFSPLALRRIYALLPETPIGLLAIPGKLGALMRSGVNLFVPHAAIHPEKQDVTPQLIKRLHQKGKRVNVFTVNDFETMRYLFELRVDGIFTDDPILANKALAAMKDKEKRPS